MRKAKVYMYDSFAGIVSEEDDGYKFRYDREYLNGNDAEAISLTLPLTDKEYVSNTLFPFFDGLIPEGWLLELTEKSWKLDARDRMGILLKVCRDCIGAVSIIEITESDE